MRHERPGKRRGRMSGRAEALARRLAGKARQRAESLRRRAEKIEDSVDEWAERVADARNPEDWADEDLADELGSGAEEPGRRQGYRSRRRPGRLLRAYRWRGLYRDPELGKIGGVCAGLGEYLGIQPWKVRVCAAAGLVFMSSVILPVYLLAWLILDKRPYHRRMTDFPDPDPWSDRGSPEDPLHDWTNPRILQHARARFRELEERLRAMETVVTSSRFDLQREFRRLSDEEQAEAGA